jgi:hypothetical protein
MAFLLPLPFIDPPLLDQLSPAMVVGWKERERERMKKASLGRKLASITCAKWAHI